MQKFVCTLMSKDLPLYTFSIDSSIKGIIINDVKEINRSFINRENLLNLILDRTSMLQRLDVDSYIRKNQYNPTFDVLWNTHAVSLADCLWIKFDGDELSWEDVNPYKENYTFDYNCLSETTPTGHISAAPNYSLVGAAPKCWITIGNTQHLVKVGSPDWGLEPIHEVLFQQIAEAIGHPNYVKYKPYRLDSCIKGEWKTSYDLKYILNQVPKYRYASICESFTNESLSYISAYNLGLYTFRDVIDYSWRHVTNHFDVILTLLCDCIGMNTGRNMRNIGFLYNPDTMKIIYAAPMLGAGTSLLHNNIEELFPSFDFKKEYINNDVTVLELAKELIVKYPYVREILTDFHCELQHPDVTQDYLKLLNQIVTENARELSKA